VNSFSGSPGHPTRRVDPPGPARQVAHPVPGQRSRWHARWPWHRPTAGQRRHLYARRLWHRARRFTRVCKRKRDPCHRSMTSGV